MNTLQSHTTEYKQGCVSKLGFAALDDAEGYDAASSIGACSASSIVLDEQKYWTSKTLREKRFFKFLLRRATGIVKSATRSRSTQIISSAARARQVRIAILNIPWADIGEQAMNRRRDYKTALLIDATIYSADSGIREHAASGLSERTLSPEVTSRIFMEPEKRRHPPLTQPETFPG